MKARSIGGRRVALRHAHGLIAVLVLSACGGGNGYNAPTASFATNSEGVLRINGQPYDPVPCAVEGGVCTLEGEQNVAYGIDGSFATKKFIQRAACNDATFGVRPMGKTRLCYVALASAATVVTPSAPSASLPGSPPASAPSSPAAPTLPPASAPSGSGSDGSVVVAGGGSTGSSSDAGSTAGHPMHAGITVDTSSLPTPQPGVSTVLLTQTGAVPPASSASDWEHDGAFRTVCNFSRMGYDDPIVYPGQPGAAHHHTFFGNTGIDAYSTSANLRTRGNATCRGGTINLSAYWSPSMIDTATNKPIAPKGLLAYYKTGVWTYMGDYLNRGPAIQPMPHGLVMIAGDASRSTPGGVGTFSCLIPSQGFAVRPGMEKQATIPPCQPGDELWMIIPFPQCWDGQHLDSPDHKSHMAYPTNDTPGMPAGRAWSCPATHPVVIPQVGFNVMYTVGTSTAGWRLASDVYSGPPGYSAHADYMEGWDPAVSDLWGIECLRKRRDCGTANLGDGRTTDEFQGN